MLNTLLLGVALLQAGPAAPTPGAPPHAADTIANGTLHGVVRAQGSLEPLPHAVVRVIELNRGVQTDEKGYFVLSSLPPGRWRAEASAIGYDAHALTIIVSQGTMRLDFELPLRPVPMPVLEARSAPTGEAETATAPLTRVGPSAVRVQSRALRTLPGLVEPDLLRSLQTLPAVAAMSDFSSALYVRGGAADQTTVMLDGMPLFNPYHLGGLFSAFPIDAVASVDVWPGSVPARGLDRLSGIVQVRTREGARDRVHATGGVGLLASHVTLDGPAGPGTFLVSGRRTYIDAVTDAAYALRLTSATVPYGFSDIYAKYTLPTGALGAVSVSGYHNSEALYMPRRMREQHNAGAGPDFRWGTSMASVNLRHALTPRFLLESRLGVSSFRGAFEAWNSEQMWLERCEPNGTCRLVAEPRDSVHVLSATTRHSDVSGGLDATWYAGRHTVRAGVQLDRFRLDHEIRQVDDADSTLVAPFQLRGAPRTAAAHVEDEWSITDRIGARLGLRTLFAGELGTAVMPRAAVSVNITRRTSLSAGGGSYAQALRSLRNDESVVSSLTAYDLLAAQPRDAGLIRGWDAVVGVAYADVATALRLEFYTRRMSRLVLQPADAEPMTAPLLVVDDYRIGKGTARGVELSAQHRHGAAEIGLAYTLAFAERETDGQRFTPRFERRHMLDVNAVWHWGGRSQLSARAAVGSGQPYTPPHGLHQVQRYDPATGGWEWQDSRLVLGEYNSARLPMYMRVDVAARREYQRRWFGRNVVVTPYLQVLNVLNHRNTLFGEPQAWERLELERFPQFPLLPTFGFEWRH